MTGMRTGRLPLFIALLISASIYSPSPSVIGYVDLTACATLETMTAIVNPVKVRLILSAHPVVITEAKDSVLMIHGFCGEPAVSMRV
ncbi:hypothetical protein HYPSUDRAFT_1020926 [Hypholoma sublateritium FD-334 SS-4]|uniref:Uncharacterized protein n=1 Tax=Hypholoma sublateritium (strain FD-334 SS-4) TaxID=945553 RepID=A0A0D2PAW9_HYPSF|nr:hypothetical protein HYPSUDRAFT_1020926 [Hypholoma sublateritium FD-334 SS-4]